jgi:hypothetical protein
MGGRFILLAVAVLLIPVGAAGQDAATVRFDGFVDFYYAYDFNRPLDRNRSFTTQPLRHNEFNLNFGFVRGQYTADRVRASMALATGTYMQSNYAAEPELFRILYEAYAGVNLGNSVWLDAGIMPSHIGFEGAISAAQWNYSRSLMAEYSPYYESGVKLTFQAAPSVSVALLAINGWQNIHETNNGKSAGLQIQVKASDKVLLNYSNYIGNEAADAEGQEDSESQLRFFNNSYASFALTEQLSIAAVFDVGLQQRDVADDATWWTGALLARMSASDKWNIGLRAEHYNDPDEVIVATGTGDGFVTTSGSINLDYRPVQPVLLRLEGRLFRSRDEVWPTRTGLGKNGGFLVSSMAITF